MKSWVKVHLFRIGRWLIDFITTVIYTILFYGRQEEIPLISNSLLLESGVSLAEKIRKGQLKSTHLVKAYISRIRDVQPVINAVAENRFQEALEEAKRVDELIKCGKKSEIELFKEIPLLGVPVSIKECIAVKGMPCTFGLVVRKGCISKEDADTVALLKKAGAIPIVTTNVPELCFAWETYNVLYGRTKNPYDTTKIPGGSSGGEGALISAGGSLMGIGSDLGGSIRMPAFFTGIFGHKPSKDIVSNKGHHPDLKGALMQSYLTIGPLCRYASDLLPMMKVLAANKLSKLQLDVQVDLRNIKVYYMVNDGGNPCVTKVHPEIIHAQRKVLKHFKTTYGIEPREVFLEDLRKSNKIWLSLIRSSYKESLNFLMNNNAGETDPTTELRKWFQGKSNHTIGVIAQAFGEQKLKPLTGKKLAPVYSSYAKLERQFEDMLGSDGVFIYPTHPEPAPYHTQTYFKIFNSCYTSIFNVLGLPVTACPMGLSSKGLPIGVQVVGALNNDHLTMAVAKELEKAFGGWVEPT